MDACFKQTSHMPQSRNTLRRLCEHITKQKRKIPVLIDELTTVNRLSVLTIPLRRTVGDLNESGTSFSGPDRTREDNCSLHNGYVDKVLSRPRFDDDVLRTFLICL